MLMGAGPSAGDPSAGHYLLLENGDRIELEDDSGELLQETAP